MIPPRASARRERVRTRAAAPGLLTMKHKILVGSSVWLVLITLLHVQLNIGWERLGKDVRVLLGSERPELVVGFLPVT